MKNLNKSSEPLFTSSFPNNNITTVVISKVLVQHKR